MSSQTGFVTSAATNVPTTTETAVLTITIPPEQNPTGQGVYLDANVIITTGAAATAVQCRIRQGNGVGGAVVGAMSQTQVAAATANEQASVVALDPTLSYPAGNTYTLTVQQVAATGNGTMVQASITTQPVTAFVG